MMEYKKLRDISTFIRTGKTPPTKESKYFEGEENWYTPGDLDLGKTLNVSRRKIAQIAFDEKKAVKFPKNTLLVGCIGDIGKIGITTGNCSSNQQLTGVYPNESTDVNYLYYWFKLKKRYLGSIANNSVVPILNNSQLEVILIPLPPLEQQKKIASILDAADTYRQKTKALIAKYDELTQSLFLDMFGDPVKNEKGWEMVELKKLTTKIGSGSTPRGGKETYHKEGISLIRSMNVYDNSFKYKNLAFINDEQAAKLKNVTVEENDVLFNITGASVCRCSVVPKNVLPARVNQHVSIIRTIKNRLNPLFLSSLLISENIKTELLEVGGGGGAVMEAITKVQLEKYQIAVPPVVIQNKFVDRLIIIEQQKASAQVSFEKAEELFNSLLQKAFKGELV